MMLPSGNDAAQTLAVYFGNYMLQKKSSLVVDGNINEADYPDEPEIVLETESDEEKKVGQGYFSVNSNSW